MVITLPMLIEPSTASRLSKESGFMVNMRRASLQHLKENVGAVLSPAEDNTEGTRHEPAPGKLVRMLDRGGRIWNANASTAQTFRRD